MKKQVKLLIISSAILLAGCSGQNRFVKTAGVFGVVAGLAVLTQWAQAKGRQEAQREEDRLLADPNARVIYIRQLSDPRAPIAIPQNRNLASEYFKQGMISRGLAK